VEWKKKGGKLPPPAEQIVCQEQAVKSGRGEKREVRKGSFLEPRKDDSRSEPLKKLCQNWGSGSRW